MVLTASRAPIEVRPQAGKMRVRVLACDLEVYVLIEQVKTLLARDLESGWTENSFESLVVFVV